MIAWPLARYNTYNVCSGPSAVDDNPIKTEIAVTVAVLGCLLLLIALLCIFKQRRRTISRGTHARQEDVNPTYGDYSDPDPRMEVEDTNDYYSSDYEAGTGTSRTTDNNPYYE